MFVPEYNVLLLYFFLHPLKRCRILFSTGLEMLIKYNIPKVWNPRHSAQRMKATKDLMGIILVFLSFVFFCPPANAIGPYIVGSKTVIDQATDLEWQKNDNVTLHTWQSALGYCETLSFDTKTDWRLPNIRELKSLVDYSRYYPAIDPLVPCQSSSYWSATSVEDDAHTGAWSVFFGNGDDIWSAKTKAYHIRCVRSRLSGQ